MDASDAALPTPLKSVETASKHPFSSPLVLIIAILPKLFMNSTIRFLFPFAAFLAEDMGISVGLFSVTVLVAGEVASPIALLLSKPASKLGAPLLATLGLCLAVLANVAVMALPDTLGNASLAVLCVMRLTFGVAFNLMTSAIQSSIASNTPLNMQGRTTGLVESSWTLAAVSFVFHGILIKNYGWKAPFVCNGLILAFLIPGIYLKLPTDQREDNRDAVEGVDATTAESEGVPPASFYDTVVSKSTLGFFGAMVMRDSAMFMVLTTYSVWLSAEPWNTDVEDSGVFTLVIALGEGSSVVLMSWISDKLGLELNQNIVNFGGVISSLGLSFFQGTSLEASMVFLGLGFLFFEWSALTSIALTGSSYHSGVRIQMISVMLMTMAVARSVGAMTADLVFERLDGFGGVCGLAAGMQLMGALIFLATRERGRKKKKGGWGEREMVAV
jgi:predicted MFS family arabinose efflux permease